MKQYGLDCGYMGTVMRQSVRSRDLVPSKHGPKLIMAIGLAAMFGRAFWQTLQLKQLHLQMMSGMPL